MRRFVLVLVMAVFCAPLRAEVAWETSFDKALGAARASGRPVLADFTAPWCYSCYYMETNVLRGSVFAGVAKGFVLARVDVDRPEGRALKEKYRVRFLPSFVVVDAAGKETGRVMGEQKEADFVRQLQSFAGPAKASAEDEAVAKLRALLNSDELSAASAVAAKEPAKLPALGARADWRTLKLRLSLKLHPAFEDLAAMVDVNDGCDLAYDLETALDAKLQGPLSTLLPRLEPWAQRRVWAPPAERCADFRSGVEVLASYYEAAGDAAAKTATLDRAVAQAASESDKAGVGQNRNLDDNRRFFLETAGKDKDLEAFYPRLIGAYPSDYVYAFRFAKWLEKKDRPADALAWIEKADKLCYGANRLSVTKVHAQILDSLKRRPEASALLRREIKAYRKALPEETKQLEELLASWPDPRRKS